VQITLLWEMDDASVYERALHDADARQSAGQHAAQTITR
jgi:hypothetical protein